MVISPVLGQMVSQSEYVNLLPVANHSRPCATPTHDRDQRSSP